MKDRSPLRWTRLAALWAVLLAVALVSLVPAGLMPGRGADGGMTLVLCSPDGPVRMTVDPDTGKPMQAAPDRCAWVLAHAAAMLPAPAPAVTPAPRAATAPRVAQTDAATPHHIAPAPLPRGPPSLT